MKKFFLICTTADLIRLAHHLMLEEKIEVTSNLLAFIHQRLLKAEECPEWHEVLLPTGAKVYEFSQPGSRKNGRFSIMGYAHDLSDLTPYLSYSKKRIYY